MKLLLRRTQKPGWTRPVFVLDVRAEISDSDKQKIRKYKLGMTELYRKYDLVEPGTGLAGLLSRIWYRFINLTITVDDLAKGKRIVCEDVVQMLQIEEHVRKAVERVSHVLRSATHFGGEEVVDL